MHIYKISFINQGKVYEIYAKNVQQSELFGFIEIADLVFDENSGLVIDPSEEKLKTEFSGVSGTLVPMQSIIRIDKVEKRGQCKIRDLDTGTNVSPFPSPIYTPPKKTDS